MDKILNYIDRYFFADCEDKVELKECIDNWTTFQSKLLKIIEARKEEIENSEEEENDEDNS